MFGPNTFAFREAAGAEGAAEGGGAAAEGAEDAEGARTATGDDGGVPREGGQAKPQSLHELLPEDLRDDPALKDFTDVAGLAKSFKHTQQMVGADKDTILKVPGEAAGAEEWNEFFAKLGRPEKPDNYEIDPKVWETENGEGLVGVERDEQMEKDFLNKAHELGLTNKQAKGLYEWQADFMKQRSQENVQAAQQAMHEADQSLRQEWGRAYDEKLGAAHRALSELADDKLIDLLDNTGLGNHPAMVKLFAQLGEYMGEDTTRGEEGGSSGTLTPKAATAEIEKLQADDAFMKQYTQKDANGHKQAVEKMQYLFRLAYPE